MSLNLFNKVKISSITNPAYWIGAPLISVRGGTGKIQREKNLVWSITESVQIETVAEAQIYLSSFSRGRLNYSSWIFTNPHIVVSGFHSVENELQIEFQGFWLCCSQHSARWGERRRHTQRDEKGETCRKRGGDVWRGEEEECRSITLRADPRGPAVLQENKTAAPLSQLQN